ncbi:DUF1127 domain-containing protein [Yoonia sp.]|uniref:DUF1127 domain-containing protein n=1 Tax=Yoonia sp. TaxID=2212373 RepID=UPI00391E0154
MTSTTRTCALPAARPSLWRRVMQFIGLARQRRDLRDLEPHLLDDIGVTRQDALREAEKPLWDVPRHWRR